MADEAVTKDLNGETRGRRNREEDMRRNKIRRLVFWLSACLMFIAVVSNVVYAQQFRYEACKLCNGTGKTLCKYCGGNRCQMCNFSGVQENPACLLMGCGRFDCSFCKGSGKSKVDTRFEHCFRTMYDVGVESNNAYLCPDNHPVGRVVIVDSWESGKILKKYTRAEWDKKEADEKAEKERKVEEERAKKEEEAAERARQEAEREKAEKEHAKQVKPQIEAQIKEMEQQQERFKRAGATLPKGAGLDGVIARSEALFNKYGCANAKNDKCAGVLSMLGLLYFDQAYAANELFINEMKDYVRTGRGKEPVRPTVDCSKSIRTYWQLTREYPSFSKLPDVYFQLSQVYFVAGHADSSRIVREQLEQLIPRLTDGPQVSTTHFRLGDLALAEKDYDKANNHLKQVKKKDVDPSTWEKVQSMLAEIKKSRK